MKKSKLFAGFLAISMVALQLAACGSSGSSGSSAAPADSKAESSQSADSSAAPASGEAVKINMIAKGFQHQFWKAVEQGAMKA